jgi:hypothetical protein
MEYFTNLHLEILIHVSQRLNYQIEQKEKDNIQCLNLTIYKS